MLYSLLALLQLAAALLMLIAPYKVGRCALTAGQRSGAPRGEHRQGRALGARRGAVEAGGRLHAASLQLPAAACWALPDLHSRCRLRPTLGSPCPSATPPEQMTELFFRNMHLPHKHEDIGAAAGPLPGRKGAFGESVATSDSWVLRPLALRASCTIEQTSSGAPPPPPFTHTFVPPWCRRAF